jgi:hypothetical protein
MGAPAIREILIWAGVENDFGSAPEWSCAELRGEKHQIQRMNESEASSFRPEVAEQVHRWYWSPAVGAQRRLTCARFAVSFITCHSLPSWFAGVASYAREVSRTICTHRCDLYWSLQCNWMSWTTRFSLFIWEEFSMDLILGTWWSVLCLQPMSESKNGYLLCLWR